MRCLELVIRNTDEYYRLKLTRSGLLILRGAWRAVLIMLACQLDMTTGWLRPYRWIDAPGMSGQL